MVAKPGEAVELLSQTAASQRVEGYVKAVVAIVRAETAGSSDSVSSDSVSSDSVSEDSASKSRAGDRDGQHSDVTASDVTAVEHELLSFAESLRQNDNLQRTIADHNTELSRRLNVISDIVGGHCHRVALSILFMLVSAEMGGSSVEIIMRALEQVSAERNRRIARVRSAVKLTQEQLVRLRKAIEVSSGFDVDIHAVVDTDVVGGVITEIGDHIIDGSVRSRIHQMNMRQGTGTF